VKVLTLAGARALIDAATTEVRQNAQEIERDRQAKTDQLGQLRLAYNTLFQTQAGLDYSLRKNRNNLFADLRGMRIQAEQCRIDSSRNLADQARVTARIEALDRELADGGELIASLAGEERRLGAVRGTKPSRIVRLDLVSASASAAIFRMRSLIARLRAQIESVESDNESKRSQADGLLGTIQRQGSQIRRDQNAGTGLLAAFSPAVALAKAQTDQRVLRSFDAQVEAAANESRTIGTAIRDHAGRKTVLERRLVPLEDKARELEAKLVAPKARTARRLESLRQAAAQVEHQRGLLEDLRAQVDILKDIRDDAAELGVALDGLIEHLEALSAETEALEEETRQELLQMLVDAGFGDPSAVIEDFLEGRISDALQERLQA
jgi:chromosome segregation ATPase